MGRGRPCRFRFRRPFGRLAALAVFLLAAAGRAETKTVGAQWNVTMRRGLEIKLKDRGWRVVDDGSRGVFLQTEEGRYPIAHIWFRADTEYTDGRTSDVLSIVENGRIRLARVDGALVDKLKLTVHADIEYDVPDPIAETAGVTEEARQWFRFELVKSDTESFILRGKKTFELELDGEPRKMLGALDTEGREIFEFGASCGIRRICVDGDWYAFEKCEPPNEWGVSILTMRYEPPRPTPSPDGMPEDGVSPDEGVSPEGSGGGISDAASPTKVQVPPRDGNGSVNLRPLERIDGQAAEE